MDVASETERVDGYVGTIHEQSRDESIVPHGYLLMVAQQGFKELTENMYCKIPKA